MPEETKQQFIINEVEPIDIYSRIQNMVQKEIDDKIKSYSTTSEYNPRPVADHHHDGIGSSLLEFGVIQNKVGNICFTLIDSATNTSVTSSIGGKWYLPFNGVITDIFATVDTAGTTGTMTIDINKNGTSIFSTTLSIDSTETTSLTAATPYILNVGTGAKQTNFIKGDYFTFDIDAVQTTPAKGLKIYINTYRA